ncbi:MAG: hypothetical protein ABJP48_01065 [Erythrobacter sp.]
MSRFQYSLILFACLSFCDLSQARAEQTDAERLDRIVIEQKAEARANREAAIAARIAREKQEQLAQGEVWLDEIAAQAVLEAAEEADGYSTSATATVIAVGSEEAELGEPSFALTEDEITDWAGENYSYNVRDNPTLYLFEKRAKVALSTGDLDGAAVSLAQSYDVETPATLQLLEAYLTIQTYKYVFDDEPAYKTYRQSLIEAVRALGHADFAVVAATDALASVSECRGEDWDAIIEGATDIIGTAWLVAQTEQCSGNFVRFLEIAPTRPMPMMIEMAHYGTIEPAGSFPIYEWLTQEAALERIAPFNRQRLITAIYRRQLDKLLQVGMDERALELFDGLSEEQRAAVLQPDERSFVVEVDGLPLYLEADTDTADLQAGLAATLALAGRREEANSLLSAQPRLSETRAWFNCIVEGRSEPEDVCRYQYDRPTGLLLVDHFLNKLDADPYLLAETLFAARIGRSPRSAMAEVTCALFAADRFEDICLDARRTIANRLSDHLRIYNKSDHDAGMAAIASLGLFSWSDISLRYQALTAQRIEEVGGAPEANIYSRGSIDPIPTSFAQMPLPDGIEPIELGEDERKWPEAMAPLPRGFFPVRWELQGEQATAISISPIYDPSGEVSMGGYWVHLSEDAGVNWQEPLYTGLSEFFPYAVRPKSALPLRDGDLINLDVSIRLIDTASITYPPIGLRSKEEQDGLYLKIPVAELRNDSDGDGLSDISEAHLLLDREGTDAPVILGHIAGIDCSEPPSRAKLARVAILSELFEIESRPIIEPLTRSSADSPLSFGDWRTSETGEGAPLFLKGDPEDFACLSTDRLVIIYDDQHIEELQRRTPDFRTIEIPNVIWNEVGDRGYVKWSAGWTGGTLRLIWNGKDWDVGQISSWIT